jgi:hypothetical protein
MRFILFIMLIGLFIYFQEGRKFIELCAINL